MVRLSVTIRGAELVKQGLQDLTTEIPKIGTGDIYRAMFAARRKVMTYPTRFEGKYPWATEKQRRFVMMAIRTGLLKRPYRRSGRYNRGWTIKKVENGYMLIGRAMAEGRDYTKYVGGSAYGTWQAQIHSNRWTLVRNAVDEQIATLPAQVADHIVMVARRKGFQSGGNT